MAGTEVRIGHLRWRRGAMNPARSLPASAVVELWALSASAVNLSPEDAVSHEEKLRPSAVWSRPADPRPTCAHSRCYWIS